MPEVHTCRADLQAEGLQDGCLRCAELAEHPIRDLDETMLANLVALAVDRERLSKGRSENELVAAATVLIALERTGRLAEVAPDGVAEYLRDRWKLPCEIYPRRIVKRERSG